MVSSSEMAAMLAATWDALVVKVVGKGLGAHGLAVFGTGGEDLANYHNVSAGESCQDLECKEKGKLEGEHLRGECRSPSQTWRLEFESRHRHFIPSGQALFHRN